jgi:hypothetical protein
MVRWFNKRYAVIRTSGGVRILVEPRTAGDDVTFETQNDVSLYERNKVMFVGGNRDGTGAKKMEAFKLWLEWEAPDPLGVVFAPGRTSAATSTTCSGAGLTSRSRRRPRVIGRCFAATSTRTSASRTTSISTGS